MTDQKVYTLTLPAGMVQGICRAVSQMPWEWAAPIMDAIRGQVAQADEPSLQDKIKNVMARDFHSDDRPPDGCSAVDAQAWYARRADQRAEEDRLRKAAAE